MKEALNKIGFLTSRLQFFRWDFNDLAKTLDELARSHTASESFGALLDAKGGYFPSLLKTPETKYDKTEIVHMNDGRKITAELHYAELDLLALAYDMMQEIRGDSRRAFRS